MSVHDTSRAVRRVVVVVVTLGGGCLALSVARALAEPVAEWWRWATAMALAVAGEAALVLVRNGGSHRGRNWRESVFLVGLVLLPPAQLVFAMVAGVTAVRLVLRRGVLRTLFNTGAGAIEITVAVEIARYAHVYHDPASWTAVFSVHRLLLVLAAVLSGSICAAYLTAVVVAAERGRRLAKSTPIDLRVDGGIWLRNIAAGLAAIACIAWSPIAAGLLLVILIGGQVFTADRIALRHERGSWHRLQEAIAQLRDVEIYDLIAEATPAVAEMMRADAAEIEVFAISGFDTKLRGSDVEPAHTPVPEEGSPGHSIDVALETGDGQIGRLRLMFNRTVTLNETENDCLNAFASALAVAIANALKFDAIRQDAFRRVQAAYVDPVTGVGNLLMLEEEARATLPLVQEGNLAAVAVIGLNRFAEVNDLLGAHAADQMLRAVATRLGGIIRRCDVVARLHGAEYVLLFRELASESAAEAQADTAVRSLGTAITADGLDLTVDAHTGVACAPTDGTSLDDLVRRARLAMYKARSDDVPVFRYQPELEPPALAQVELLRDLRDALSKRQLVLHFQPKFSLRGGIPVAAEALVRWQHPERGMIPPAEFIPLLERCGLVGDLTRYVLEAAIEECAEWQRLGLPLSVAVNLSARNLLDEDLPRFVLETLARYELPTDRLICEITETAVFSRSPIAVSVLDQMRAAGVELSLDDFCTGYSSLSLLRERTIDEIKIDRSFVADLGVETRSTQIVTTLIELAHRCDIIVTAEGIETVEQQQLLTSLGCDLAQGYLLARPMPAEKVRPFFLDAMHNAPVTPLPREPRGRARARNRAEWNRPDRVG